MTPPGGKQLQLGGAARTAAPRSSRSPARAPGLPRSAAARTVGFAPSAITSPGGRGPDTRAPTRTRRPRGLAPAARSGRRRRTRSRSRDDGAHAVGHLEREAAQHGGLPVAELVVDRRPAVPRRGYDAPARAAGETRDELLHGPHDGVDIVRLHVDRAEATAPARSAARRSDQLRQRRRRGCAIPPGSRACRRWPGPRRSRSAPRGSWSRRRSDAPRGDLGHERLRQSRPPGAWPHVDRVEEADAPVTGSAPSSSFASAYAAAPSSSSASSARPDGRSRRSQPAPIPRGSRLGAAAREPHARTPPRARAGRTSSLCGSRRIFMRLM